MSVELKPGMRISALRMSNKAIALTGTIEKVCDDGKTVEMTVDGAEGHIETVHINDVTILLDGDFAAPETAGEKDAAELRGDGIDAKATAAGVEVDIP
jgi:hypothetical protein